MPSTSLEKRLAALEQVRERASVMNILFGNTCSEHFGMFRVTTGGGRVRYEQRLQDEPWNDFQKRMDVFATGILRLVTFMPVTIEGNDLLCDETPEEFLQ